MDFNLDVVSARVCPYCNKPPEYVDSSIIYGKSYGMIYLCKECDAYVGTHKTSKKSLGRLADRELREDKKRAHFYFDQLWKKAVDCGRSKREARTSGYRWLSDQLGVPEKFTHIGMFDKELCDKVVNLCRPYCLMVYE